MSVQRSPPPSPNKGLLEKSASESNLAASEGKGTNVTIRNKRPRLQEEGSSPKSSGFEEFKSDLLGLLTTWKTEQDQRLSTWKDEQSATLTMLVKDMSDLKLRCEQIQNSNSEIEKGMDFINKSYEDMKTKITGLETEKKNNVEKLNNLEKQIQDMRFQTRPATIELRNVPVKQPENIQDLEKVVTDISKVMELDIKASDLRDIYRLPGKGSTRPIIAEFASVSTRNDFLGTVRRFNKDRPVSEKLNTTTIKMSGEKKAIYADEYLTPALKKLLFEARKIAKTHNYSCWHSYGRILMRTEPDGQPIHIITEKSLDFLGKQK